MIFGDDQMLVTKKENSSSISDFLTLFHFFVDRKAYRVVFVHGSKDGKNSFENVRPTGAGIRDQLIKPDLELGKRTNFEKL